jgi:hypothetical protein
LSAIVDMWLSSFFFKLIIIEKCCKLSRFARSKPGKHTLSRTHLRLDVDTRCSQTVARVQVYDAVRSERVDFRSEGVDLRSEGVKVRSNKVELRLQGMDLRSN